MRVLKVSSGDDYAAIEFENNHGGVSVLDIINNLSNYEAPDEEWELGVFEVGEVSNEFVQFIRTHIEDYETSKSTTFYLETETIRE